MNYILAFIFTISVANGFAQEQYSLGVIEISDKEQSYITPRGASNIKISAFESNNYNETSQVISQAPGVALTSSGARNERLITIRGFNLRQVPLLMDGIPVSLPYDGYVDLGRFLVGDLASVQVTKGLSSVTLGPNAIGGVVNLVSQKPHKELEVSIKTGSSLDNKGRKASSNNLMRIAGNKRKYYYQITAQKSIQGHINTSSDYIGKERIDHSHHSDRKASIKFGITPNISDEYTMNIIDQVGSKEVPVYSGPLSTIKKRYWNYPEWNKRSYYFQSKTRIGREIEIKSKLFRDEFKNTLKSYDDDNYSTQNAPYAFTSYYDDDVMGGQVEVKGKLKKMRLMTSFHMKQDHHRENNLGEPIIQFIDHTYSVGLESSYKVSQKFESIIGASIDWQVNKRAESYDSTTSKYSTYDSNIGQAFNPLLGMIYRPNNWSSFHVNASKKTRFPTMKDRYSFRLGKSLPNPDLKEEMAIIYELGGNIVAFDAIEIGTNIFYYDIDDTLRPVNVDSSTTQMRNTGKSSTKGLELGITYEVNDQMKIMADYTLIKREDKSSLDLNFTDVPRHQGKLTATFNPTDNLTLSSTAEANSYRYSDTNGLQIAKGYFIANASFTYKLFKTLSISSGIDNLFDRYYELTSGYPEAGRQYYLNAEASF